jgi:hypothetical protein
MTLVITLEDIIYILMGLFLLFIFIFCKLSDRQHKRKDEKVISTPTDKERFTALLSACHIGYEITSDGIDVEDSALEGDGYLFIKFYEDGQFQEFIHYP